MDRQARLTTVGADTHGDVDIDEIRKRVESLVRENRLSEADQALHEALQRSRNKTGNSRNASGDAVLI